MSAGKSWALASVAAIGALGFLVLLGTSFGAAGAAAAGFIGLAAVVAVPVGGVALLVGGIRRRRPSKREASSSGFAGNSANRYDPSRSLPPYTITSLLGSLTLEQGTLGHASKAVVSIGAPRTQDTEGSALSERHAVRVVSDSQRGTSVQSVPVPETLGASPLRIPVLVRFEKQRTGTERDFIGRVFTESAPAAAPPGSSVEIILGEPETSVKLASDLGELQAQTSDTWGDPWWEGGGRATTAVMFASPVGIYITFLMTENAPLSPRRELAGQTNTVPPLLP